jgi:hypothetical protein
VVVDRPEMTTIWMSPLIDTELVQTGFGYSAATGRRGPKVSNPSSPAIAFNRGPLASSRTIEPSGTHREMTGK